MGPAHRRADSRRSARKNSGYTPWHLLPAAAREAKAAAKRDFAGDLHNYVKTWRKDRETWKFSKVLQNWLLDNCFNGEKIEKQLFHDCLPYIGSVMGGARTRLVESCDKYLSDGLEEEDIRVRRAKKIHNAFAKHSEDKDK